MVQAYDLNKELLYPDDGRDKTIDSVNRIFTELKEIEVEHYRLFDIIVKLQATLKARDKLLKKIMANVLDAHATHHGGTSCMLSKKYLEKYRIEVEQALEGEQNET